MEQNASKCFDSSDRKIKSQTHHKFSSIKKDVIISIGLTGKDFERIFYELEKFHKNHAYRKVVEFGSAVENDIGFENIEDPMLYHIVFYLFYAYQQTHQLEKASELYEKLVHTTADYLLRDDYEILLKLSAFYYFLKRYDDAIPVLARAEKLYPNDFKITYSLGIHLFENRQFKEAEAEFEKANKIRPNDVDVMIYLGMTYQNNLKFQDAEDVLLKARTLSPDNFTILSLLKNGYTNSEKPLKQIY